MGIASKPVHGKLNHIAQHLLTIYLIRILLTSIATTGITTSTATAAELQGKFP